MLTVGDAMTIGDARTEMEGWCAVTLKEYVLVLLLAPVFVFMPLGVILIMPSLMWIAAAFAVAVGLVQRFMKPRRD